MGTNASNLKRLTTNKVNKKTAEKQKFVMENQDFFLAAAKLQLLWGKK